MAVLVGVGLAGATVARAEPFDVKLGLWEITSTTESRGAPPIDTSRLTPEQRGRVEAALKARQGTRTETRRECLTKEKLEKDLFGDKEEGAHCKHVVVSSTRTVRQERMECAGESKLTGEMRFEALSREKVNGIIKMTAGEGPRTMTVNSTMAAKWIGADCGDQR